MKYIANTAHAISCNIGDEVVLLRLADNNYLSLNETGVMIWDFLQDTHSLDEIVNHVASESDVVAKDCEGDIKEFISAMVGEQLIAELP